MNSELLLLAQNYIKQGLSIIPIKADGSKAPDLRQWKSYQSTPPQSAEIVAWFGASSCGVAIITGAVSGRLEVIDFDDVALITPWLEMVKADAPALLEKLPMVSTPTGGMHVYYRCEQIGWNTKLAERVVIEEGKQKPETLIETRAEGGYVLAPGCPAACHPSRKTYDLIQGDLLRIPTITPSERELLIECAKAFNERVKEAKVVTPGRDQKASATLRPGDDFNQRGDLRLLLEKHGWERNGKLQSGERWKRPAGTRASATLFHGSGLLYVFSTNAQPFDCDRAYTPFAAYAALEHHGDFAAAARALGEAGYGDQSRKAERGSAATASTETVEEAETEIERRTNPYKATEKGLIKWVPEKSRNGTTWTPLLLTNFTAEICADLIEDDGVEARRSFELTTRMGKRRSRFITSAEDFAMMKWPITKMGASAVIHPGQADKARCAIQVLSENIVERYIYSHTGWREIDGEMCFLHGGGAIGPNGCRNVEVRLSERLQLAVLPEPAEGSEQRDAVRAVLDLTRLAPEEVMIPCIGSAFSSIVGGADFSLWLYGGTGSGKSEVAALIQSFFGKFTAKMLPGSWMSTANSQEIQAYAAKDMIFVMDDFKPVGGPQDRLRLYKEADRLMRAQGNGSGRQRMLDGSKLNQTKYPRGLIFNTAEEVPRYESLIARLFVVECNKASVDFTQLTAFQAYAANGMFAAGTASFLQWIATRYEEAIRNAPKEIISWRNYWSTKQIAQHRRCATTLGHLSYAWKLWLQFAYEIGAISQDESQEVWERVLVALTDAARWQDQHTLSQNPVARFQELLLAGFASLRIHLENRDGGEPPNPGAWGWRWEGGRMVSGGTRVGWIDDKYIYLSPDAAYEFVNGFSISGGGVGLQQTALWKMMFDEGKILEREPSRQTYTVRKRIMGVRQSVLVLAAENLLCNDEKPDPPDPAEPESSV